MDKIKILNYLKDSELEIIKNVILFSHWFLTLI